MSYRVLVPMLQVAGATVNTNYPAGAVLTDDMISAEQAAHYVTHGLIEQVVDDDEATD
ncbi:hypothetical protein [Mycobacterium sherrisii]|uniref:hypothetical protein n=1 Tax=Mycobacterium sherrisii TaxID=243061 RepID=UPI0012F52896|nr:hypothetical protein [Mycobacterium sherrisii]